MADFDFKDMESTSASGIDALFEAEPKLVIPTSRVRLASLQQLQGFTRVAVDTLVHKSDRDLWALRKEADGSFFIERLYDDNGQPLKG
jgi:hypothetical protein